MFFRTTKPRIFAIGDIHGCVHELAQLIQKMRLEASDTVVFLGDYIDRGPDSRGVIDLILDLKKKTNVVALMGNHEQMLIDFLERPESIGAGLFVLNGGGATLSGYAGPGTTFEIPNEHLQFFRELKLTHETEKHFFVHAGVPNIPLAELSQERDGMTLLWVRQPFLQSEFLWEKIVVHGHTPVEKADVRRNRINLDTGCVYDGHLTAMDVVNNKIYTVERSVKGAAEPFPRSADGVRVAMRFTGRMPLVARKPNEAEHQFETLNYNKFGVLMRELVPSGDGVFKVGEVIIGTIGPGSAEAVEFTGEVVRVETRSERCHYGIKITAISDSDAGYQWVESRSS